MTFTRKSANLTPIQDTVFAIVKLAKEDKEKNGNDIVTDATIGSLADENGNLVAYDNVFKHYDKIDARTKAAYAASFIGNANYRDNVYKWVCQDHCDKLNHSVIATVGGSGAVSMTISNILDKGQTVILPDIAWGSYKLMASQFELDCAYTISNISKKQDKILVVINDPCHNPTGYTLTVAQWQEIVSFINEVSKEVPCVILNDIAYIDYSYDLDHVRDYMECYNELSANAMAIIAFSCSKTLTSYGLRCGAAILLTKDATSLRETEIVFEKSARSVWSNIHNPAMQKFDWVVIDNIQQYL